MTTGGGVCVWGLPTAAWTAQLCTQHPIQPRPGLWDPSFPRQTLATSRGLTLVGGPHP